MKKTNLKQLSVFIVFVMSLFACDGGSMQNVIAGRVTDENGPVEGATVRVQATDEQTVTDTRGMFVLVGLEGETALTISAWKDGYYCAKVENVTPPASNIDFTLTRYQTNDNPEYEWVPPEGANSCMSCKPSVTENWLGSAHAGAAKNERFLSMYNGTDIHGNASPLTRYVTRIDYGAVPLPPDPDRPYYGPGYKLDFPATAGNCAACHVPGAAIAEPYGTDPNEAEGADAYGVHCDYCHKIADVILDPETDLPYENRPGVLSTDIRRPFPDDPERFQLFFGTFDDDNVPEEDTYLPLMKESRFCAPCHFGTFWNTVVYNSYGEWLESPYSDPATGLTCQQCHMPAPMVHSGAVVTNVAPGRSGVEREPMSIHTHLDRGAQDTDLMQNAVAMHVAAVLENERLSVTVDITNDKTGHHVPTDSPLRHLILVVSARDTENTVLSQTAGTTLPEWCGVGDVSDGCYANLPGKVFAKVLEELWTGISPTANYWSHFRVKSDNRIAAFATDTSRYVFDAAGTSTASVTVRLLYRRAYKELMDQKGWDVPDMLMEEASITARETTVR